MARRSRGYMGKCPNFTEIPRGDSSGRRMQECLATHKGDRFLVQRYSNGRLVAWHVPPKGGVAKARRLMLPTSTRSTRSLSQLLEDAHGFVSRVRGRNN